MKKIAAVIFLLVLGSSVNGWSKGVRLEWTPNKDSDLTGYRVYRSKMSGNYTGTKPVEISKDQQYTGTDGIVWVYHYDSDLQENDTYYWVVSAYDSHNRESRFSNEVTYTVPDQHLADPASPGPIIDPNDPPYEESLTQTSRNEARDRYASSSDDGIFYDSQEPIGGGEDDNPFVDCSDGVGCTDDLWDDVNNKCKNTPNDDNCPDDELFCNGNEICDPLFDCVSTGPPCGPYEICSEETYTCEPLFDEPTLLACPPYPRVGGWCGPLIARFFKGDLVTFIVPYEIIGGPSGATYKVVATAESNYPGECSDSKKRAKGFDEYVGIGPHNLVFHKEIPGCFRFYDKDEVWIDVKWKIKLKTDDGITLIDQITWSENGIFAVQH